MLTFSLCICEYDILVRSVYYIYFLPELPDVLTSAEPQHLQPYGWNIDHSKWRHLYSAEEKPEVVASGYTQVCQNTEVLNLLILKFIYTVCNSWIITSKYKY